VPAPLEQDKWIADVIDMIKHKEALIEYPLKWLVFVCPYYLYVRNNTQKDKPNRFVVHYNKYYTLREIHTQKLQNICCVL